MEFKIGDIVNINPESEHRFQGMSFITPGTFMNGIIITEVDYVYGRVSLLTRLNYTNNFNLYVRWGDDSKNNYREKDLILSVTEHRDKQLNIILDGI
jgi:hypothetical protein